MDLSGKEVSISTSVPVLDEPIHESGNIIIAKNNKEVIGKISIKGNTVQDTRKSSKNICPSQISLWEKGMYAVQNGVKTEHANRVRCKDLTTIPTNTDLYFNTFHEDINFVLRTFDENKNFISSIGGISNERVIKFNSEVKYLGITLYDTKSTETDIFKMLENGEIKPFICLSNEMDKSFIDYGTKPSLYDASGIKSVGDVKYNLELGTILAVNGGNADNNTRVRIKEYIKVVPGAECIIDAEGIDEVVVFEYDKDKKYLFRVGWEKIPYTFNLSENTRYIRYALRKSNDSTLAVDSIKDKSEYLRSIEITTSNKNMYDKEKFVQGIWNANETTRVVSWLGKIKAGQKITIKRNNNNYEYLVGVTTMNYKNSANALLYNGGWRTTEKSKMTITKSGYIFLQIRKSDNSSITSKELLEDDFQVEFNEETDFVEHRGQTLLMPLQQKMFEGDTFERIGGIWYEVHNKKRLDFDGTENWIIEKLAKGYNRFSFVYKDILVETEGRQASVLSNYFNSSIEDGYNNCFLYGGSKRVFLYAEYETVDEFKSMLAQKYAENKAVYVIYQLAEPQYIKCTPKQVEVLEKLNNTELYPDTTIITTDDENAIIELDVNTDETIPFGNYIVDLPNSEQLAQNTSSTAYDYMIKFRIPYKHRLGENFTAGELFIDICDQAGVTAGDVNFVNSDYVILGNAYTNNETCEMVLRDLAKLAIGYARIDRFNKCQIHTLSLGKEDDVIDGNDYKDTFEKSTEYGEVNKLSIGMTGVDGEWVTRQNETSIAQNGETLIENNDIYFLINEEERNKVADNMWSRVNGLKYLSSNFEYKGFPYLDAGDKIKLLDVNDKEYTFYVFNHEFTYNGAYLGKIDTPLVTKVQQQYKTQSNNLRTAFRNVQLSVNKVDGKIEAVIEQQDEMGKDLVSTTNRVSKIEQDIDGISTTVSSVETKVETIEEQTVSKVDVMYALSSSETTAPTTGWSTTAPAWSSGKYMWQKTVTTYGDGTNKETSATCISGAKGQDGSNGKDGADGTNGTSITIKSSSITYQASSSGTITPTGTWSATIPTLNNGQYLWTKTVVTYSDNKSTTAYSVAYKGTNGKDGVNGQDGAKGDNGTNAYTHIRYSNASDGSNMTTNPSGMSYIGIYNGTNSSAPTTATSYTWSKFKGETGAKGDTGATGKGIKSVTNHYLATTASSNVTSSTSGWTDTIQSITSSKRYLWNYETITYTDNSTTNTTPVIIGVWGNTGSAGASGKGIKSITEHYQVSTSNSTVPTNWVSTVPTMTSTNKYLWNYETITYTDNSTSDTTKRVIGAYGDKGNKGDTGSTGKDGNGINSITYYYATSTTQTAPSASSITNTSIPTISSTNKYLWQKEVIDFTDSSVADKTSVVLLAVYGDKGTKGDAGSTGIGVKAVEEQFYLSTSNTSQTGGSWKTTQDAWSSGKYIWTRNKITWTDNTTTYTTPVLAQGINNANNLANTANQKVDNMEVGARNYVLGTSKEWSDWITPSTGTNKTAYITTLDLRTLNLVYGDYISLQLEFESTGFTAGKIWTQGAINGVWSGENFFANPWGDVIPNKTASINDLNKVMKFTKVYQMPNASIDKINNIGGKMQMGFRCDNANAEGKYRYRCVKIEKGNKVTDWTPAPEDVQTDANNAINIANKANNTASSASTTANNAKSSADSTKKELEEFKDSTGTKITTIEKTVKATQDATSAVITVTQDIKENGVSKVKTETGYTFDQEGLKIEKNGAKTKSKYDEAGMSIIDNTGSSEENLLFAGYDKDTGETVVKSKNMTVEKYLTMGKHSRIEDYETGTGIFYIGE